MKRDFWGTAQNVAQPRRAVVRTAERASCGAVRCARTRSMVVYAILALQSIESAALSCLMRPVPIERLSRQRRQAVPEGVPGSLVLQTPRTLCALAAPRDARAHGSIEEAGTATPGITHYSLLPAAELFAASNLNSLLFYHH